MMPSTGPISAPGAAPPPVPAVETRRLTIAYGRRRVLEGIDLAVAPGEVYALLGRNGSGKSSLIRTLLGQQRAGGGEARLLGLDGWRHRAPLMARVGVVPEDPQAPPGMTSRWLIAFRGRFHSRWDPAGAAARLARFAVPLDTAFGELSRGQKKQVELALALAQRPELLVLDDPTLGLDAVARRGFFAELVDVVASGETTVLLTSHDLAAVEGLAARVGILHGGRLVVDEAVETLKGRFRRLRGVAANAAARQELGVVASRRGPWGEEAIASRAEGETGGEPMSLEEIFAALTAGPREVER